MDGAEIISALWHRVCATHANIEVAHVRPHLVACRYGYMQRGLLQQLSACLPVLLEKRVWRRNVSTRAVGGLNASILKRLARRLIG